MNFFTYLSRNALKALVFTLASSCSCLIKPPAKSLCTGWTKSLDKNSLQSLPRNPDNLNTNFGGYYVTGLTDTLFPNGKFVEKCIINK